MANNRPVIAFHSVFQNHLQFDLVAQRNAVAADQRNLRLELPRLLCRIAIERGEREAAFCFSRELLYNGVARFGLARLLVPGVRLNLARFTREAAYDHRWGFSILK
ncbi:MAG: hypothetical protein KGJ80_15040 [Chloroflexota bacterium]|nr:hypothetical protein [Chloroflexota bacterium]